MSLLTVGSAKTMALSYESIIASAPFRFLVGSNKRLFTVHVAAIAHYSKPLGVLVNGDMLEAKEGCVWMEDVEESTFIRFSQFAYTGNYIAADPEILLDSSTIAWTPSKFAPSIDTDEPLAVADEKPTDSELATSNLGFETELIVNEEPVFMRSGISVKKKGKRFSEPTGLGDDSRKEKLWKLFEETGTYTVPKPSFRPRKNRESCEDYTDVFLCHARLYTFAEKYDIAPLKKLAVNRLHQTLSVFNLYKERVGDIVALMRYSYANTVHRSPSDDPLRSLLIHYAACVVENLVPSSEFKALLEEPGELASDLVVKIINRLE